MGKFTPLPSEFKKLRAALGISQEKMALLIDRSLAMVRLYEKGTYEIPDDVQRRLSEIARKRGVIYNPKSLGGTHDTPELVQNYTIREVGTISFQQRDADQEIEKWVLLLRAILNGPSEVARRAITSNLEAFAKLCQLEGGMDAPESQRNSDNAGALEAATDRAITTGTRIVGEIADQPGDRGEVPQEDSRTTGAPRGDRRRTRT